MIDVGIIGLDTSHAEKFAALLDEREETTVAAVWDGGEIRDTAYEAEFCAEHGATACEDPQEMIGDVDAAMVLTVDWTTHGSLAAPFLEAGVPTMIDKPIAGTVDALNEIEDAAASGDAPLFGGSAVPFHSSVAELAQPAPETTFCAGYGDPFYYGAHLTDTVRRLVGSDWRRVEPVAGNGQTVRVHFEDGSTTTLRFDGSSDDGSFGFLTVGKDTETALIGSSVDELERMYEPFLNAFLATVRNDRDDTSQLLDAGRLLLAVQRALEDDAAVTADSEALVTTEIPSELFVANYEPYY